MRLIHHPMNPKPTSAASNINNMEPPYCFASVKELMKNQTRYNQYNIFHMVERLRLLKSQGIVEPIDPVDESTNAYKMYKDFVVPPLPPAYADLDLPPHWLIHMFCKKEKRRSHKKSVEGLMSFRELAQAIADGYKQIDSNTKAWLDEVSGKLLVYNKEMREELATYLQEQEKDAEKDAKKVKEPVADAPEEKTQESRPLPSDRSNFPRPDQGSARSPDMLHVAMEENEKRRYMLKLQAAKLSLEMQELNSGMSPASMRRDDFMMMYPSNRRGAIDRYGLSPYVNHIVTPRQPSGYLSMRGAASIMPPLGRSNPEHCSEQMSPEARAESLIHKGGSPKRKQSGESADAETVDDIGVKRAKTESPLETMHERQSRLLSRGGFYSSEGDRVIYSRDSMPSSFAPFPYSMDRPRTAGLAGLRSGLLGSGSLFRDPYDSNTDQLMLGYQLGLKAAARASAPSTAPRRMTNDEIAVRLQAMDSEMAPSNRVQAQERSRMTNDEIAFRLQAMDREMPPSNRVQAQERRPPPSNRLDRTDAFTRSEFGLPLSEIEQAFIEMKRGR